MNPSRKFFFSATLIVFFVLGIVIYFGYYFVANEGSSVGRVVSIDKQQNIFETYEGVLLDKNISKLTSATPPHALFLFSIADDLVAQQLILNHNKLVELHYKTYNGALPWRGTQVVIVDSVTIINSP